MRAIRARWLVGGTVKCWGQNTSGQLGNNSLANAKAPVQVSGLSTAIAITAGASHSCALLVGGMVECWGLNTFGQLGNLAVTKRNPKPKSPAPVPTTKVPVAVDNLAGVTAIGAGAQFSCALLADGTAQCWGLNSSGQLGNNSLVDAKVPVGVTGVAGGSAMTALAAGAHHECGLLADSTVECWGDNEEGQLGNGTVADSRVPVHVIGVTGAIAVDVGRHFSCALLVDGTIDCWGYNLFGELGRGTIGDQATIAAPVVGLGGVTALASGDHHTCAVTVAGTVACWGWNLHGELAIGAGGASGSPIAVAGLTGVTATAAEDFDSCALLANGTAECWGYNAFGELGNNTTTDSSTPGPVLNLSGVTMLAMKTDSATACAVLVDGTLQCWGYNGYGELGRGVVTGVSVTPGAVTGLSGVVGVTLGDFQTCALLFDGTVRCWGYNAFGQLGNGVTTDSAVPVLVNNVVGCDLDQRGRRHVVCFAGQRNVPVLGLGRPRGAR